MLRSSAFSRIFSGAHNTCRLNTRHLATTAVASMTWTDNLFVNYLQLPKYMRIHGPTGEEVTKNMDLTNKTCIITGGTSGIGAEIVRCLIARNCDVVMACRNPYAAIIASKNIWRDPSKLKTYETNLTSLTSVKKFTDNVLRDQKKIDMVILNAAVFGLPWTITEDGLETIFQVNFLSQFYLLMNIEKILAPDARVVFLSSESHRNLKWNVREQISPVDDLLSLPIDKYTSIRAYNASKVCGILAMHYLSYRWVNQGKSVFCAHPGSFVKTKLCSNWWVYETLYTIMDPFTKSIQQAAATPLYCATSPDLQGQSDLYFKDCKETDESDMTKNNIQLSFRIIDLVQNMLRERISLPGEELLQDTKQLEFNKQYEVVKPEIHKPQPVKPEVTKPELIKPEITKPEQLKPEHHQEEEHVLSA